MRAWINADGELYLARMPRSPPDRLAPPRPSQDHQWLDGAWALAVVDREAKQGTDTSISRALFEVLYQSEIDKRELRKALNAIQPGTFQLKQVIAITRAQYRAGLIAIWKSLP